MSIDPVTWYADDAVILRCGTADCPVQLLCAACWWGEAS